MGSVLIRGSSFNIDGREVKADKGRLVEVDALSPRGRNDGGPIRQRN